MKICLGDEFTDPIEYVELVDPINSKQRTCPLLQDSRFEQMQNTSYAQYFTKSLGVPEEWHTRKLPHRNRKNLLQFITFRLADSLPKDVLTQIEKEVKHLSEDKREVEKRKRYQVYLDRGLGCCALKNRTLAQVVFEAFKYHEGDKYDLLAWSIMPNHVHVLIRTKDALPKIVQSWKSFTGKWALSNNKKYQLGINPKARRFWMPEYWDRFIRDEAHFNNTVKYILNNPKKARLLYQHTAYQYTGFGV